MKSLAATLFAAALLVPTAAYCGNDSQVNSWVLVNHCISGNDGKVQWCATCAQGVVDAACPDRSAPALSLYADLMAHFAQRITQGASDALPTNATDLVVKVIGKRTKQSEIDIPDRQLNSATKSFYPRRGDSPKERAEDAADMDRLINQQNSLKQ